MPLFAFLRLMFGNEDILNSRDEQVPEQGNMELPEVNTGFFIAKPNATLYRELLAAVKRTKNPVDYEPNIPEQTWLSNYFSGSLCKLCSKYNVWRMLSSCL